MAGQPVGPKPALSGGITSASLPQALGNSSSSLQQMATSTSLVTQRRLASPAPRAPTTPAATVAAPATAVAFVRPPLGMPVYSVGSSTGRKGGSFVVPPPGASQQAYAARPPVYVTAAPGSAAATSIVTAAPVTVSYAVAGAPEGIATDPTLTRRSSTVRTLSTVWPAPTAPAVVAEPAQQECMTQRLLDMEQQAQAQAQAQAGATDPKHIEELRSALAQLCGQVRQQHEEHTEDKARVVQQQQHLADELRDALEKLAAQQAEQSSHFHGLQDLPHLRETVERTTLQQTQQAPLVAELHTSVRQLCEEMQRQQQAAAQLREDLVQDGAHVAQQQRDLAEELREPLRILAVKQAEHASKLHDVWKVSQLQEAVQQLAEQQSRQAMPVQAMRAELAAELRAELGAELRVEVRRDVVELRSELLGELSSTLGQFRSGQSDGAGLALQSLQEAHWAQEGDVRSLQEELAVLRSGEAAERERLAELHREFSQFREVSSELMGLQQQFAGLRCNHNEDQARIDKLQAAVHALQEQGLPVQLVQLREHLHELEASVSLQVQELQLNGNGRSSTACHEELALTVQELQAACANDRAEWQEAKFMQVQSVEHLSQQLQEESQKRCADVADLHRRLARDIAEVSGSVVFLQEAQAQAQPRELDPGAELRGQLSIPGATAQALQRIQEETESCIARLGSSRELEEDALRRLQDQARSCEAEVGKGVQQVLEQSLQSAMLRIQEQTQACKLEVGEAKEEALERILESNLGREQEARAGAVAGGAKLEELERQIKKEESDRILAITSMMLELRRGMEAERDERSQRTRDLQAECSKLVGEERDKRIDQVTQVVGSTEQNRKELLLHSRALCSAHRKDIGKVLSSWRSSLAAQGLELQPWEALNEDGELPEVVLSPSSRTDDAAAENSGFFGRLFGSHRWNSSSQPGSPVTVGSIGDPGSPATSPIQAKGLELRVPSTA